MRNLCSVVLALLVLPGAAALAQTSITRVSTPSVQLQAGGTTVPLTVEGTNLGAVTSVRLLAGGRAVTGIDGVLRRTATTRAGGASTSLVVDLTVASTVTAGSYQLELLVGTERITVPVSITVLAGLRQPQAAGQITLPSPTVARATPATTVALRVGGPAQTVVLEGSLLDQIAGVFFERSGNRVYGIRGELQPSTDPARRSIILSALANAGPPWSDPIDLVLDGRMRTGAIMTPVRVATPVRITAAAAAVEPPEPVNALPDLTISGITVQPSSGPPPTQFAIKVMTRNAGAGTLGMTSVGVQCLISGVSFGASYFNRRSGPVEPGQSVVVFEMRTPAGRFDPGVGRVECTVDPYKELAESNENNNRFVIPFVVTK